MMNKLTQKIQQQMIGAWLKTHGRWYVGDPCYIIPDDQWNDFCEATFKEENKQRGDRHEGGHIDSVIDWHGQEITLWSNGGDGTWSFSGFYSANGATSFSVDAGIFCVIDLHALPRYKDNPMLMGMLFNRRPNLYVEDGCVYLNGEHDDHHMTCENWRCGRVIDSNEYLSCGNGCCEGCDNCGKGWECEEE